MHNVINLVPDDSQDRQLGIRKSGVQPRIAWAVEIRNEFNGCPLVSAILPEAGAPLPAAADTADYAGNHTAESSTGRMLPQFWIAI